MYRCLWLAWFSLTATAFAQGSGFQLSLVGQRQLAMGLAGSSLVYDASSAFLNPGALVFVPHRTNLLFGGTASRTLTQYLSEQPSTYQVSADTLLLTPVYFYGSWKGKADGKVKWLALGLSINNPFGTATRWNDQWRGKFISQEFVLNTLFIQPTVSFRLSDQLGLGIGGTYALGTFLSRRAIQIDGPNGTEGSARFSGTGNGVGFNLGLSIKVDDHVRLGLTYRSAITIQIDSGMARFNVPESVSDQFVDQAFATALRLPGAVSLGLSYQPQERLLLAFELSWVGWQVFDSLRLELIEPVPNLRQYPERAYEATLNFRVGGEYRLNEHWNLRAGLFYDNSPVPQDFLAPDIPDANRIGLTTGLGVRVIGGVTLDVSYAYAYTGERTATLRRAAFSGVYQSTRAVLGLGLGYAF
jgi:long-chain fatty acid transport protein